MLAVKVKEKRKNNLKLLGVILSLALPTMFEQLMQTAVQYVDIFMVGTLGTAATAAAGATTTVNWLIGSTLSALSIGFLALISRSLGAGNEASAKKYTMQGVIVTLIVGVAFTAITLAISPVIPILMQVDEGIKNLTSQYFFILYLPLLFKAATIIFGTMLRAAGDSKTPMKIGILVNALNVILNFFLIYKTRNITIFGLSFKVFGAGLGVVGAAAASAVSIFVGGVLITVCLLRHPKISPKAEKFKADFLYLKPCLKISLPNMLQRFATSFGYVVFASMINSLGEISTAAHTVANTVESAFYIPAYGMQTAAATLSGNCLGARDNQKMKDIGRIINIVELILMTLSGAVLFAIAPKMVGFFSSDPAVIDLGTKVLRWVAFTEPFYGVSIIIEGILQGVGETKIPFIFNIMGMWGVRIVGTFIFVSILRFGLTFAWGSMILHNLLLFTLFLVYYFKGNWNPLMKDNQGVKEQTPLSQKND